MKNFTLLLVCLMSSGVAFAQIPNAGFENWSTVSGQSYDDPDQWGSSNSILVNAGGAANVFKDASTKNGGTASARLETKLLSLFGGVVTLNISGALVSGTIDYNTTNNSVILGKGFPFTTRPGSLTGYYKYTPSGNDAYSVAAILWKWNSTDNKRDTLAIGFATGGAQANFSQFGAVLNYTSQETPDSAMIVVLSTAAFIGSAAGSTLWVDDLSFEYGAGVNTINENIVSAFPNPAQNTIYLNAVPGQFTEAKIYDMTGKLVATEKVSGTSVNVNMLANGNYIMMLNDSKNKAFKAMIAVNR